MTSQNRATKFADLRSGGRALARLLRDEKTEGAIVLGIVRAGVPVGCEVASALELPLDLVLLRALFQRPSGDPVRAAAVAGTLVLDEELKAGASRAAVSIEERFAAEALAAFGERQMDCRGDRAAVSMEGRTVILVDSGMRTGATMAASIRALRHLAPARIVAAVPVSSRDALLRVEGLPDALIHLATPEPYGHVAMAYGFYDPPREAQIHDLMGQRDAFLAGTGVR
jgi:putative phosphoribosyl transferase